MKEIWKDIKGYEDYYQISNLGNIKSLKRLVKSNNNNLRPVKEKILKKSYDKDGYLKVGLNKNGKGKCFSVHRLVAEAFIPNPNNYPIINHKDENKQNNYVNNLEWCSVLYNNTYGNAKVKCSNSLKKPILQINLKTGKEIYWNSALDIAKQLNYDNSYIGKCCKNRKKGYGYIWKYAEKRD